MSEQLFERGDFQIIRGAFRCDVCENVKRGTQRWSRNRWVGICDECEGECRQAMDKPSAPVRTAQPSSPARTPGAGIEAISSRQVSEWLEHLCCILNGEVAKVEALGMRAFDDNFNWLGECHRVAQWLWDAKFYIRDPWPLRVAVKQLIEHFDLGGFVSPQRTSVLMDTLRTAFEPFKGNL